MNEIHGKEKSYDAISIRFLFNELKERKPDRDRNETSAAEQGSWFVNLSLRIIGCNHGLI